MDQAIVIKLLHQSACGDILSIKPYFVSGFIQWGFLPVNIIELVYRSAFLCTRVAGSVVVVVLELVGELRCHIPSNRSIPESLR